MPMVWPSTNCNNATVDSFVKKKRGTMAWLKATDLVSYYSIFCSVYFQSTQWSCRLVNTCNTSPIVSLHCIQIDGKFGSTDDEKNARKTYTRIMLFFFLFSMFLCTPQGTRHCDENTEGMTPIRGSDLQSGDWLLYVRYYTYFTVPIWFWIDNCIPRILIRINYG